MCPCRSINRLLLGIKPICCPCAASVPINDFCTEVIKTIATSLGIYPLDKTVGSLGGGVCVGAIFIKISEYLLMPAFSCAIEPSQLFEKRCLYVIFFFPHSYLFLAGRRN